MGNYFSRIGQSASNSKRLSLESLKSKEEHQPLFSTIQSNNEDSANILNQPNLSNRIQKLSMIYKFLEEVKKSVVGLDYKIFVNDLLAQIAGYLFDQINDPEILIKCCIQVTKLISQNNEASTNTNLDSTVKLFSDSNQFINLKDDLFKLLKILAKQDHTFEYLELSYAQITVPTNDLEKLNQDLHSKDIAENSKNMRNLKKLMLSYWMLFSICSNSFKPENSCMLQQLTIVWKDLYTVCEKLNDKLLQLTDKLSQLYENFNKLNEALFDLNKLTLDQDKKLKLLEILSLKSYKLNTDNSIEEELDSLNATITTTLKSFNSDDAILTLNNEPDVEIVYLSSDEINEKYIQSLLPLWPSRLKIFVVPESVPTDIELGFN